MRETCARKVVLQELYNKDEKQVGFEHMAQRASIFGAKKPGKVW